MKAIIVDDELLLLNRLKHLLIENGVDVVGAYVNPLEACEKVKELSPDVVFLDIEMPDLNGLALGERIQESQPETEIVFVTAYDRYAVDAFNLYAIDYVMKPVQMVRLRKTISRLENKLNCKQEGKVEHRPTFKLFKTMSVVIENGHVETMKWRTAKAQELFAYMFYNQGTVIYRDTILELFWSDFDTKRAAQQLYTTVYHIRQTLKKYQLDTIHITKQSLDSGYRLDKGEVLIDTEKWETNLKNVSPLESATLEKYEQLLYEYEGDYLGEHDYVWAESERERLRRLYFQLGNYLTEFYINNKQYAKAIKVNERIQQIYPLEENSYLNIMKLYDKVKNGFAVEEQYNRLLSLYQNQFETEPSEEIKKWYKKWKLRSNCIYKKVKSNNYGHA